MPLIDLSDVRLHYEIRGCGPALLLIPGLGQTLRGYDAIVPCLSRTFSVIQVDNRGIGSSLARKPARRMEDYASDYVELLDALQLDRAHVLGVSFGGVVAQRLASDHSSRIDRLVLVSTTDRTYPYLGHIAVLLGHALRHFPLALFFQTIELLGTAPEHFDAHADEIMREIPLRSAGRGTRRVLAGQLRCLHQAASLGKTGTITAPTLVIAGEYDALIPNCYSQRLAADLPDGKYVMMKGCGHNPITEQPDVVVKVIDEFLKQSSVPRETNGRGLELGSELSVN